MDLIRELEVAGAVHPPAARALLSRIGECIRELETQLPSALARIRVLEARLGSNTERREITMRARSSLSRKLTLLLLAPVLAMGLTQCADLPTIPRTEVPSCAEGKLSSGALYRICTPTRFWNGGLVLFTPGIMPPFPDANTPPPPPTIDDELQQALTASGFAVAMTGFRGTGVAVLPNWIEDLTDLVSTYTKGDAAAGIPARGKPKRTYLTGGSQGGLITTLALEQHPEIFSGGLAACGPIGDYQKQVDYLGDFRVVFDYMFGRGIQGWPTWIQQLPENPGFVKPTDWIGNEVTQAAVARAIATFPDETRQLLQVTDAAIDRADPNSVQNTVLHVLSYSFLFTDDLINKAGGLPYDNLRRLYGSANDGALNSGVKRFAASPRAPDYVQTHYQTSGKLTRPLVTLHTSGDELIPYWHEDLYRQKVLSSGSSTLHANWQVQRYGHCNFTTMEMLSAFALLVLMVDGHNMVIAKDALPSEAARAEVLRLARQYGAAPEIVDRAVIASRAQR